MTSGICPLHTLTLLLAMVQFDIPAGAAPLSLNAWATQADIQLLAMPYSVSKGVYMPEVRGKMLAIEALGRLFVDYPNFRLSVPSGCVVRITFDATPPPQIQLPRADWVVQRNRRIAG